MNTVTEKPAVVLLSGGLDSATVLAMATDLGYQCHALSVDYGQRHRSELVAAENVASSMSADLKTIELDLRAFGGSALTDDIDVPEEESEGIPVTYVPARNTIMLSLALAWAEVLGAGDIFIGVNAVDYSGYPDCRPEFINAYEEMANLATKAGVIGHRLTIHTPLLDLSKADIIRQGTVQDQVALPQRRILDALSQIKGLPNPVESALFTSVGHPYFLYDRYYRVDNH